MAIQLSSYSNKDSTPIGTLIYSFSEVPPHGYLVPNGAEVSRSLFDALFSVIGTRFGEGDGKTTFNLPDVRPEGQFEFSEFPRPYLKY